ncbi:MAG: thioredoxin family protein [Candidatus Heimdallarchaeota archaeon]
MVYEIIESTRKWIEKSFTKLDHEVELLLFTAKKERCLACNELEELAAQLAELSPKIKVTSGLLDNDAMRGEHRIDKHPAMLIHGLKDYNIRYFGVPSGLEFNPFIEIIVSVSTGMIDLPQSVIDKLRGITDPIHIQVFTTPTCPYCPKVVRMVHQFAMINDKITSDMIDAMEFRELAMHYGVFGVPKTVINDKISLDGLVNPDTLIDAIFEALKKREISFHV